MRVLLIDDEQGRARPVAQVLADAQIDSARVDDAATAIAALTSNNPPHLVVAWLGRSGLALRSFCLKARELRVSCPILFVLNPDALMAPERALTAFADDIAPDPSTSAVVSWLLTSWHIDDPPTLSEFAPDPGLVELDDADSGNTALTAAPKTDLEASGVTRARELSARFDAATHSLDAAAAMRHDDGDVPDTTQPGTSRTLPAPITLPPMPAATRRVLDVDPLAATPAHGSRWPTADATTGAVPMTDEVDDRTEVSEPRTASGVDHGSTPSSASRSAEAPGPDALPMEGPGATLLLQLLAEGARGRLIVQGDDVDKALHFHRGELVWVELHRGAAAIAERLRAGHWLRDDEPMPKAHDHGLLTRLLVEDRLHADEVDAFARSLVRERGLAFAARPFVRAFFVEGSPPPRSAPTSRENPLALAIEARRVGATDGSLVRAWDEVARAALLPGPLLPGVSLRVAELLGGRRLDLLVDGNKSGGELAAGLALPEDFAATLLIVLCDAGVLSCGDVRSLFAMPRTSSSRIGAIGTATTSDTGPHASPTSGASVAAPPAPPAAAPPTAAPPTAAPPAAAPGAERPVAAPGAQPITHETAPRTTPVPWAALAAALESRNAQRTPAAPVRSARDVLGVGLEPEESEIDAAYARRVAQLDLQLAEAMSPAETARIADERNALDVARQSMRLMLGYATASVRTNPYAKRP